jgi:tetratricopeptide (TPR) repeat protein
MPTRIEVAATRAKALLRCGRSAEALERALEALGHIERAQSTSYFSLLPYGHAMEVLLRLAKDENSDLAVRAQEAARRMFKALRSYAALLPVARIQRSVWAGTLADMQGRTADALRSWRSALQAAQNSQVPLDAPLACRWLACGLSGPERVALLQRAADGFAMLGHNFDADEARAMIDDSIPVPTATTS